MESSFDRNKSICKINIEHDYHSLIPNIDEPTIFSINNVLLDNIYTINKKYNTIDKLKCWMYKDKDLYVYDYEMQILFIYLLYLQKKNKIKLCNLVMCKIIEYYTYDFY